MNVFMHTMQPKTMVNRPYRRHSPQINDANKLHWAHTNQQQITTAQMHHGHYKLNMCRPEILACMNVKFRLSQKSAPASICTLLVSFNKMSPFDVAFNDCFFSCLFAVPKTEPIGDTVRYVKEGSRVALHCVISGAIDPPLYVIWYHGQQQIFPDNTRQWKTEISHQDIQNKLPKTDDNEPLPSVQQSMFESRKTVCKNSFNV